MKIKAWGVTQGVWGGDKPEVQWFRSKEDRDAYCIGRDHIEKISSKAIDESIVAQDEEWREAEARNYRRMLAHHDDIINGGESQ